MADAEVTLTHQFVSTKADGADTTKVKPSDWNDPLVGTGGDDGEVVTFDSTFDSGLGAHRRAQVLDSQYTAVGNVGAGSDALMTYTLPAATLASDGRRIKVRASGRMTGTASTKTGVVAFGGTAFQWNSKTTAPTAALNWYVELEITRMSATTQVLTGWAAVGTDYQSTFRALPVETLANAVALTFYGTDSAAVSDAIQQDDLSVTLLN